MIATKSPMRISLFGGSTDYKSFYEQYGSFLIGSTIDKYAYNIIRFNPSIIGKESIIRYSKLELVENIEDIENSLIRETLKYYNVKHPIQLDFISDVPTRTGLGGSSSYCAALARSICVLLKLPYSPTKLCLDTIKIEREILKDAGGIQDQIWACHGGFKCIIINKDGTYSLTPVPGSKEFHKEFKKSLILIYSKKQRNISNNLSETEEKIKLRILDISKKSYNAFKEENIKLIGRMLYDSWLEKRNIVSTISDTSIDQIICDVMNKGAYGAKLLGGGGAGFVLVVCNENVKKLIKETYTDAILDFKFSKGGIKTTII